MVSNDRSLTNQKDGLGNSLNLTNQDFYVRLVDVKNKENNGVLAGHSFSLRSRSHFDFPHSLSTACHAGYCNVGLPYPGLVEVLHHQAVSLPFQ